MTTINVLTGKFLSGSPHYRIYLTETAARAALPDLVLSGELVGPARLDEVEVHGDLPGAELAVHLVTAGASSLDELLEMYRVQGQADAERAQAVDSELERRRRAVEQAAATFVASRSVIMPSVERQALDEAVQALREYAPAETSVPPVEVLCSWCGLAVPLDADGFLTDHGDPAISEPGRRCGATGSDHFDLLGPRRPAPAVEPEQVPALAGVRAELHEIAPGPWTADGALVRSRDEGLFVVDRPWRGRGATRIAALLVQLVNGAEPAAPLPPAVQAVVDAARVWASDEAGDANTPLLTAVHALDAAESEAS